MSHFIPVKKLIENFSNQLCEAIRIGESAKLSSAERKIQNVLIAGVGGSGIGGTIVRELTEAESEIPIVVSKGYSIPGFVNENTLSIISSYSGNTEETISALHFAIKKKAPLVCITSGGKIAEIAKKKKLDLILIPGGMPPRACLGYSFVQQLFVLSHFGITRKKFKSQIQSAIALLEQEKENIIAEAKIVAQRILGKTPVIYAATDWEGVAIRFRQQLNENAKMLCGHHVIPEMNHNELVGWASGSEKVSVLFLRDADEFSRNNSRIQFTKQIISKYTSHITEVWSKGKAKIEKAIYLIHFADWVSVLLAEMKGVDAMETKVIDRLKNKMAKSG